MSDIVERLRSHEERFIFQGGSEFAVKLADEIEGLRAELAEAVTALPQAVRNEREQCARLCDDYAAALWDGDHIAERCAAAIRSRK